MAEAWLISLSWGIETDACLPFDGGRAGRTFEGLTAAKANDRHQLTSYVIISFYCIESVRLTRPSPRRGGRPRAHSITVYSFIKARLEICDLTVGPQLLEYHGRQVSKHATK